MPMSSNLYGTGSDLFKQRFKLKTMDVDQQLWFKDFGSKHHPWQGKEFLEKLIEETALTTEFPCQFHSDPKGFGNHRQEFHNRLTFKNSKLLDKPIQNLHQPDTVKPSQSLEKDLGNAFRVLSFIINTLAFEQTEKGFRSWKLPKALQNGDQIIGFGSLQSSSHQTSISSVSHLIQDWIKYSNSNKCCTTQITPNSVKKFMNHAIIGNKTNEIFEKIDSSSFNNSVDSDSLEKILLALYAFGTVNFFLNCKITNFWQTIILLESVSTFVRFVSFVVTNLLDQCVTNLHNSEGDDNSSVVHSINRENNFEKAEVKFFEGQIGTIVAEAHQMTNANFNSMEMNFVNQQAGMMGNQENGDVPQMNGDGGFGEGEDIEFGQVPNFDGEDGEEEVEEGFDDLDMDVMEDPFGRVYAARDALRVPPFDLMPPVDDFDFYAEENEADVENIAAYVEDADLLVPDQIHANPIPVVGFQSPPPLDELPDWLNDPVDLGPIILAMNQESTNANAA